MNDATPKQSGQDVPTADAPGRRDPTAGPENETGGRSLSFFQVVGSTLAAAFGVQSSRNRERDFSQGRVSHFIVAGIIFTVAFVIAVIVVVRLVLSSAGA